MADQPIPETEFLRGFIEPGAVDLRPDHDGQIRLSIAISLKRIADFVDGDSLNYNSIIDLFWQAGQAFERGKGT